MQFIQEFISGSDEERKVLCQKYISKGIETIKCIVSSKEKDIYDNYNDNECAICLNELNDIIVKLECRHIYDLNCFDSITGTNIACPFCRKEVNKITICSYDDYDCEETFNCPKEVKTFVPLEFWFCKSGYTVPVAFYNNPDTNQIEKIYAITGDGNGNCHYHIDQSGNDKSNLQQFDYSKLKNGDTVAFTAKRNPGKSSIVLDFADVMKRETLHHEIKSSLDYPIETCGTRLGSYNTEIRNPPPNPKYNISPWSLDTKQEEGNIESSSVDIIDDDIDSLLSDSD